MNILFLNLVKNRYTHLNFNMLFAISMKLFIDNFFKIEINLSSIALYKLLEVSKHSKNSLEYFLVTNYF